MPKRDVALLLADRWAARRWSHGAVDPVPGGSCRIVDRGGIEWFGEVVGVSGGLTIRLSAPAVWPGLAPAEFRLEVVELDGGTARIDVYAEDPEDPRVVAVWQAVLRRLGYMVDEVRGRREPEQAVVVVHGIGEQRPGATLRSFVSAMVGDIRKPEDGGAVWSGHDEFAGSYELRQLTLTATAERPRTAFYEYYWADKVQDTTLGDVLGWVWTIMGRWPWSIPPQLRVAWAVLWGLAAAVALMASSFFAALERVLFASTIVTLLLGLATTMVVRYLGDAARYLSARPRNVAIRHAIRSNGIQLLRELHESGRFQRIVLVGHSLGSVVAYDIVTHLWPEMNRSHLRPERARFSAVAAAHARPADHRDAGRVEDEDEDCAHQRRVASERARGSPKGTPVPPGYQLQGAVWREMRRNTQPWLVTDLVTLGSPLAHADLLMARTRSEFEGRLEMGELPACPPVRTAGGCRFSFNRPYRSRSGRDGRSFTVLAQSAPFAAVRWTNLYFPARLGIFGDLVGGPVGKLFGADVVDVPLRSNLPWWARRTILAHTRYWRKGPSSEDDASRPSFPAAGSFADRLTCTVDHVEVLRTALRLDSARRLRRESSRHDPLLYCRTER